MQIILFEDSLVDQLAPITLGRPAFDITCAGWRLIDLIGHSGFSPVLGAVREHLRDGASGRRAWHYPARDHHWAARFLSMRGLVPTWPI